MSFIFTSKQWKKLVTFLNWDQPKQDCSQGHSTVPLALYSLNRVKRTAEDTYFSLILECCVFRWERYLYLGHLGMSRCEGLHVETSVLFNFSNIIQFTNMSKIIVNQDHSL